MGGGIDWKTLTDAYGEASKVPALIARLSADTTDPSHPLWEELWSRLCHQGTVYPASYAALPLLLDYVRSLAPERRLTPLSLVGAIVASEDLVGVGGKPRALIDKISADALRLTEECMAASGQDRTGFVYLLAAACAFKGDPFWGRHLDGLVDGEYPGRCPSCAHDLYLVIGEDGFFVTAEEWTGPANRNPERVAIAPKDPTVLSGQAEWLHRTALRQDQPELAWRICHLFGAAKCPSCRDPFDISRALDCD